MAVTAPPSINFPHPSHLVPSRWW